jgi:hypothetical protein
VSFIGGFIIDCAGLFFLLHENKITKANNNKVMENIERVNAVLFFMITHIRKECQRD